MKKNLVLPHSSIREYIHIFISAIIPYDDIEASHEGMKLYLEKHT